MRRGRAAAGSVVFFVIGPGVVAGLVPWLLTRWDLGAPWSWWLIAQVLGVGMIAIGLLPLISAFVQFARAHGTPAPMTPTERLVVDGANRFLRNPMYAGLLLCILGQALLFSSWPALVWFAVLFAATAITVRFFEEPSLQRRFGAEYETYRRAVPAYFPRLRPWAPPDDGHS